MSNSDDHPVQFKQSDARRLSDIHVALIGNKDMGTPGLVSRVQSVETKVESHDRKFWFVTIVGTGVWAFLVAFKEQIFGHGK